MVRLALLALFITLFFTVNELFAQDMDLAIAGHYLQAKPIIKLSRDFDDPYMWILAANNQVYRMNTLTKQIDDYTPKFQGLNNYDFFDITGIAADWVMLLGRDGVNVSFINVKSGVIDYPLKQFAPVLGNVNSIGSSSAYTELGYSYYGRPTLLIGSDRGFFRYSFPLGLLNHTSGGQSQIFSSTYRDQVYEDYKEVDTSGARMMPLMGTSPGIYNFYPGVVRKDGTFGEVKTAYLAIDQDFGAPGYYAPDMFWGGPAGLFQTKVTNRTPFLNPFMSYLKNININKISDIFGLIPFGIHGERENLLVATDNGLYYSNSLLRAGPDKNLINVTLHHFDNLGNVPVTYVEVNNDGGSFAPFCENGIWAGTNDGFYLLSVDYSHYVKLNNISGTISFKSAADMQTIKVCAGDFTTIQAGDGITTDSVQWYRNNSPIAGQNHSSLAASAAGEYYALFHDGCSGFSMTSNRLNVELVEPPLFTFNYPDRQQVCGTQLLRTDNKPGYRYRWYADGVLNGDTLFNYAVVKTGKYKVEVSTCTNSWVTSKEVEVDVISLPVPDIQSDKPAYCTNDNASLSITAPPSADYTIDWYKDNVLLPAYTDQSSISTNAGGAYSVTIVGNIPAGDGTYCTEKSVVKPVSFNSAPTVNIQKIVKTTLCDGQSVDLKVTYNSGAVQWSTGETSDVITVNRSGTYGVTVGGGAACSTTESIDVQFVPNPVLNLPNGEVCALAHRTVTLIAPPGMATYTWNGENGTPSFVADHPQTVTLTVTDMNGCRATQEIVIGDACADVTIPNTFTPNGDGINDTWHITGLEYDPTTMIKIFNRYGKLLYQSRGLPKPWEGTYQGKKLEPAAYYYVITAKSGKDIYSGSVTIIY